MKKLLIVPVLLVMFNCAESKKPHATDPTTAVAENGKNIKTVEGEVVEINQGKDGYTAKLKNSDGIFYFVTISRVNLKDPAQYKTTKVGEKLKISGEFWKMENENQITVREIL